MIYVNANKKSAIMSVEFAPSVGSNYLFVHLKKAITPEAYQDVRKKLAGFGAIVTAESKLEGSPILVVRGPQTQYEMLAAFNESGDMLKAPEQGTKLTPWKLRGYASMVGQTGQIMSAWLNAKGLDGATMTFATLNMIANVTNVVFGGETKKDDNRLIHLKREFNKKLREYIPAGVSPPSSYDQRLKIRHDEPPPPDLATRAYNFIKRNSVTFCEIGLRYVGSIALVVPFANWKKGVQAFSQEIIDHKKLAEQTASPAAQLDNIARKSEAGIQQIAALKETPVSDAEAAKKAAAKIKEVSETSLKNVNAVVQDAKKTNGLGLTKALMAGFKAAKHVDNWTLSVGAFYILGKSIGLTSKVPDPYDPKPHSVVDTLREKVTFRLSSMIEFGAAGILVYDRLFRKIKDAEGKLVHARTTDYKKMGNFFERVSSNFVKETPKWIQSLKTAKTRDWFGGIGGALFAGGFLIRLFAPFGSKEVDMKELNAHITDGLAKVPDDKLPQVLAEFAAKLTEEFKGQVEYGEVFRTLEEGLHKYHGISIDYNSPEQGRGPEAVTRSFVASKAPEPEKGEDKSFTKQYAKRNVPVTPSPSARSKAEQVAQTTNQEGVARAM